MCTGAADVDQYAAQNGPKGRPEGRTMEKVEQRSRSRRSSDKSGYAKHFKTLRIISEAPRVITDDISSESSLILCNPSPFWFLSPLVFPGNCVQNVARSAQAGGEFSRRFDASQVASFFGTFSSFETFPSMNDHLAVRGRRVPLNALHGTCDGTDGAAGAEVERRGL